MKRRGHHEGSIYQRKDGRWVGAIDLGHGEGKRKRKYVYGSRRQDVAAEMARLLRERQQGLPVQDDRLTVQAFLDDWLESTKRPSLRPRTFQRYQEIVRLHITPHIGRLKLGRLDPSRVQRLYSDLQAGGMSAATAHHVHRILRAALEQATRWNMIPRNPASIVTAPKVPKREMDYFAPAEVRAFLKAAADSSLEALFVLACHTGAREGELLALHWTDIDLEARSVHIRRALTRKKGGGFVEAEPKSRSSVRRVPLSAEAVEALGRHKARQAEAQLALGAAWQDRTLVFTNRTGGFLEPKTLVEKHLVPVLEAAGLRRIRFHDLRHTAASLMFDASVNPRSVSEILGHSSVAFTLDRHGHLMPGAKDKAIDALARSIRASSSAG